jgi:glycosyltransferase involved in cell wall biosynthesis
MKIVEIIPALHPIGGAERLVYELIECFSKRGIDDILLISLYSHQDNKIVEEIKKIKNVKIVFLEKKVGIDFLCARKLRKVINDFKPDVVHCHLDSIVTIWLSGIYRRYKTFFTVHTIINEKTIGKRYKIKNILYKKLFSKKKITPIAISNIIRDSICTYYKLDFKMVDVVENGVPIEKYANTISLNEREIDFIYIGRFIALKNPLLILKAFLELKKQNRDIKMLMIGEGSLLEKCKVFTFENKINDNVLFTGFVNDVPYYLKKSKFLILASSYEGNPMVVNEAIASKCYVISTKVGGVPDIVNEKNGLLINYSDNIVEELTKAMAECLNKTNEINDLINQYYSVNQHNISIENTCLKYENIFKEN